MKKLLSVGYAALTCLKRSSTIMHPLRSSGGNRYMDLLRKALQAKRSALGCSLVAVIVSTYSACLFCYGHFG